jgi:hypothetical protein
MRELGRLLIVFGLIAAALGVVLYHADLLGFLRLGRLPGDISIRRGNFRFYFPLTTSIVVSLVVTFVLYLLRK